jgi:hypothetical protein
MPVRCFRIKPKPDILASVLVIVLQRQQVIGLGLDNRFGDALLATPRVNGYQRTANIQHRQQVGNGGNRMGFFTDSLLHQHPARLGGLRTQQMHGLVADATAAQVLPSKQICSPDRLGNAA